MKSKNIKPRPNKKQKTPKPTGRPSILAAALMVLGFLVLFVCLAGAGSLVAGYLYFSRDLPSIDRLREYNPKTVTYFYADDGRVIGEFSHEMRLVVDLDRIPRHVIDAFIAAEDSNFFSHSGIDFWGIARAAIKNIGAGRIVQGGSTITQQVTRSFLLTREKTFTRKIKEVILAFRIDKNLTKNEILYLYLNQIYLGHGAYGVQAAAQAYFGRDVSGLSIAQAALIAGLTQAPSRYSPFSNMNLARERQAYTLGRMLAVGAITQQEYESAKAEELVFVDRPNVNITVAPYFTEHVRRLMEEKYGAQRLYNDGLKVYTTVNIEMQGMAIRAIERGLGEMARRHEYPGPLGNLTENEAEEFLLAQAKELPETNLDPQKTYQAIVMHVDGPALELYVRVGPLEGRISAAEMRWAVGKSRARLANTFEPGSIILVKPLGRDAGGSYDFSLEAQTDIQAAILCQNVINGEVKAMVGGTDFTKSQFNRAVQSRRQPGSAFKPVIYSAALDQGYTPASVIIDAPLTFDDYENMRKWKPQNYGKRFYGPTTLAEALAKSRNVVTIRLLDKIGFPPVLELAEKMGITSPLNPDLTLALGSSGLSLLELVTAYSTFPRLGERIEPVFISRVEDRFGNVLEENKAQTFEVMSPQTAYVMLDMLQNVVRWGTATRLKALGRPMGGKTGTTNDLADAWFIGFTADYLAGVWVGRDELKRMGDHESGGVAAAPVFEYFMAEALANKPVREFEIPEGIEFASIDLDTGRRAAEGDPDAITLAFKEGTVEGGISEVVVDMVGDDEKESRPVVNEKNL